MPDPIEHWWSIGQACTDDKPLSKAERQYLMGVAKELRRLMSEARFPTARELGGALGIKTEVIHKHRDRAVHAAAAKAFTRRAAAPGVKAETVAADLAVEFNISQRTLFRWVEQFKKGELTS